MTETLQFSFFETPVTMHCESEISRDLMLHMYGAFVVESHPSAAKLVYTLGGGEDGKEFSGKRSTAFGFSTPHVAQFVYNVEKDMTLEWEYARSDLYFLHASALEFGSGVVLLAGQSGNGKSTTCWAMTNRGFGYLSDELSPVDLNTMCVHPYPHALCLKNLPPDGFELPDSTYDAGVTLHVPPEAMAEPNVLATRPLRAVLFVEYQADLEKPRLTPLSSAAAAANLFTHALNPLAHPNDGLAAAAEIVKPISCAELKTAGLDDTCELIWDFVRSLDIDPTV